MPEYGRYGTTPNNPVIGQFQVSGTPWLTGSIISGSEENLLAFPSATKRLQVKIVNGGDLDLLRLHFVSTGAARWGKCHYQ